MNRDKITNFITASNVKSGLWNGDEKSNIAIRMFDENGESVWLRSNDWATYALMYGISEVAFIVDTVLWTNGVTSIERNGINPYTSYVYAVDVESDTLGCRDYANISFTVVYNYGQGDENIYRCHVEGRKAIEFISDSYARKIIAIY